MEETEKSTVKSQVGAVSNGLQASPQVLPNAVNADLLTPAVQVEERIDVVEKSVSQMKTMMSQVLRAVGVKETDQELTESQVEMSSEDDGFVQVRSRRKKNQSVATRSIAVPVPRRPHPLLLHLKRMKVTQSNTPRKGF